MLKRNQVKFFVDEKNKTVVCRLEIGKYGNQWFYTIKHLVTKRFPEYSFDESLLSFAIMEDFFKMNKTQLVGIAKCSDDDVFDIKVGKDLAFHKLDHHVCKAVFTYLYRCSNSLDKSMRYLDGCMLEDEEFMKSVGANVDERVEI